MPQHKQIGVRYSLPSRSNAIDHFDRGLVIACLAIGVTCLLGLGYELQSVAFGILGSDKATIYDSVYDNGIVRFPSLPKWVFGCFQWQFMAASMAIAVAALLQSNIRRSLAYISLTTVIVLLVLDGAAFFSGAIFSPQAAIQSILADIGGGIALAFFIISILVLADLSASACSTPLRSTVIASILLIGGLSCNVALFYGALTMFQPKSVDMRMSLGQVSSGTMVADSNFKKPVLVSETSSTEAPFSILPKDLKGIKLDWNNPEGDLSFSWRKIAKSSGFDLSMTLYLDCNPAEVVNDHGSPHYMMKDASNVEASFNAGPNFFHVLTSNLEGKMSVEFASPAAFWVNQSSPDETKVVQLSNKQSKLILNNYSDELDTYLYGYLLAPEKEGVKSSGRTIRVLHGSQSFINIDIKEPANDADTKLKCRRLPQGESAFSGTPVTPQRASLIGLRLVISRRPSSTYGVSDNEATISGDQG